MSHFLILEQQRPEMSLCSICPDKGHCCRNFDSSLVYWDDASHDEVTRYMHFIAGEPMPWIVRGPGPKRFKQNGRAFSHWLFDCPKLGPDGLCTDYENRPQACRSLVPGTVDVCTFNEGVAVADIARATPHPLNNVSS
jgi:Fe-S-cluster containining protein